MTPIPDLENPDSSGGLPARPVILYPVFSSHDTQTFEIARHIADGVDGTLLLLDLVTDKRDETDASVSAGQELLQTQLDDEQGHAVQLKIAATDQPLQIVEQTAVRDDVRLVVFDEHTPAQLFQRLRGDAADRISTNASCDAISVINSHLTKQIASILVPINESTHANLAVAVAGALAVGVDAVVELFHVSPGGNQDESRATELFTIAREQLPSTVDCDTWHLNRDDVADAIIEQSNHYDVTVIGRPRQGVLQQFVTDSVADNVNESSANTVITTKRSDGPQFSFD